MRLEEAMPAARLGCPIYRKDWGAKYAYTLEDDGHLHEKSGPIAAIYGDDLFADDWMVRAWPGDPVMTGRKFGMVDLLIVLIFMAVLGYTVAGG